MTAADIFLWAVCPYISLTLLIAVTIIRRVNYTRTWTSKSSEFLEKKQERVATPLFHVALLFVFFGHLGGFLIPKSLTDAFGFTEHMYHILAFSAGGVAGTALVVGLFMLIRRRFGGNKRMRANTSRMDKVMYVALVATILPGYIATLSNADGGFVYRETLMPWIRRIFLLQPDPSLMLATPIPFKIHMICWMILFALIPFTRLVHMFSGVTAPFKYLKRAAIIYRSRKQERTEA